MKKLVLTLLLLAIAVPAFSQTPTLVQCKSDAAQALVATAVWKVNLPNPGTAGNTITASTVIGNSATTVAVTDDKGNTWNNATKISDGGNNTGLQMSYTSGGITASTQQITITYSVARSFNQVQICEWYNVATTSPLDAQTGKATSTSTITTAAFTTAANGDLILCTTFLDNFTKPSAPMSWTAGTVTNVTTPTLAVLDNASYMATQYGIQSTGVSTTATIVTSLAPTGNGAVIACIALKAGSSGGDLTGIRVRGIEVQSLENSTSYANYSGTSFAFQIPVRGNLIAMGWTGRPTNELTTIVSSPSLTWAHCSASSDSGGSGNAVWWWYAVGASPGLYSITISGFGSTPSASIQNIVDISGAASSPFDTCASNNGTQTTTPVTGPSLTPATANGLILSLNQEDRNTVTAATPGWFEATDVGVYSGSSGDTDEGLAVYLNATTATTNVSWTFSNYEGVPNGPGAWATQSISFEAPASAPPVPTLTSISPTSGNQGTSPSISFVGTDFDGGHVSVTVSGAGVTAGTPSSVTNTTMTSVFTITGGAAATARNVTVTTDGGTTGAKTFTVTVPSTATGGGAGSLLLGVGP